MNIFFYMCRRQISPSHVESKDTHLEYLMRRNDERVRSRAKTTLSRSKSMGSLQNSTGSIEALKALFESKAGIQNKDKSNFKVANSTSSYKAVDVSAINGDAEEIKNTTVEPKTQKSADASVVKGDAREDHVTRKVNISKYKDIF